MGNRVRASIPHGYVTSYPGQLSLPTTTERKMSTGQSAVMLCGWALMDKRVGGR